MNVRRTTFKSAPEADGKDALADRNIESQSAFQRLISLERKRSERSGKPFILMLVDLGDQPPSAKTAAVLSNVASALCVNTRDTDTTGWYEENRVVGLMFTELGSEDHTKPLTTIANRVTNTLRENLPSEQFDQVRIWFHVFPEDWNNGGAERAGNLKLYPDVINRTDSRRYYHAVKRVMDIGGSLAAMTFLAPVFIAVAIAVKGTSKGPVLFRQQRVGQFGHPFTFLKFRSMYVGNDSRAHEDYVKQLIAGKAEKQPSNGNGKAVYKLTKDSRVTTIGAFLRKTSLDELPQFFNVLIGEMSLVGPRPPLPYEVKAYDVWHRSRLLEAKPGITGLWQVSGRSRVTFDEMVRLDLRYAREWSPWTDIKILMRTPVAVLLGEGAH